MLKLPLAGDLAVWSANTDAQSALPSLGLAGAPLFHLGVLLVIVAGGLPIFFNDQIVGGIGCSSGHADQDEVVAQAGIDAIVNGQPSAA